MNPGATDNESIRCACTNGHNAIVRQLLQHPKCDPAAGDNRAVRVAAYAGHAEVIKILLTDLRVNASAEDV